MISIIFIVAWIIAGTVTFRRTGYTALNRTAEPRRLVGVIGDHHERRCWKGPRYEDDQRSCDCSYRFKAKPYLPWVFTYSMMAWPMVIGWWASANGVRLYSKLRGKEIQFFIPAPKVKTHAELLADSEQRRKELEEKIETLERETL